MAKIMTSLNFCLFSAFEATITGLVTLVLMNPKVMYETPSYKCLKQKFQFTLLFHIKVFMGTSEVVLVVVVIVLYVCISRLLLLLFFYYSYIIITAFQLYSSYTISRFREINELMT